MKKKMTLIGGLTTNTTKALSAGAIAALVSYLMNGSGNVNLFGTNMPLFIVQGATVSAGVFITENVSSYILPQIGLHPMAETSIYLAEPAITGLSSAGIMAMLGGFDGNDFLKDTIIGMASTTAGVYAGNALPRLF